jgi:branched-chain amino acid transport system substrate-binding protein
MIVAALFILGLIIGAGAVYGLGISSSSNATATTATTATTTTTIAGSGATKTTTLATTVSTTVFEGAAACDTCLGGINNTMLIGAVQAAGNLTGTFTIGNLQDLTDGLAGQGADDSATSGFALTDINAWLQTTPLKGKVTFTQNLQDYKEDNTLTATIMNSFLTQGIAVTIGPLNSGTAGAMLPFANSHHIVMISPSSTNPAIAIPGDYLFRTPPADQFQGAADAAEFKQVGAQDVVILYRNDGYGQGLANSTATNFKAIGGHVEAQIPYDITIHDFSSVLGSVNDAYNSAVGKYGASHVALYFISFDEFGQLATQAKSGYPALLQSPLPWFGTDGTGNEAPIVNSTYSGAAAQSRLVSSFPGFSFSPLTKSVCDRQLKARSTLCTGYTVGTYDDMWLAALAILYCHGQNGQCIKNALPSIAAGFSGATGVTILNSAGDRLYASYQFFCIVPGTTTGSAKWIVCGTYDGATQTVNWIVKPSGIP